MRFIYYKTFFVVGFIFWVPGIYGMKKPAQEPIIDQKIKDKAAAFNAYEPNNISKLPHDLKSKVIDLYRAIRDLDVVKVVTIVSYYPGVAKIGYPHKAAITRLYKAGIPVVEQEKINRILTSLLNQGANINKPIILKLKDEANYQTLVRTSPAIDIWQNKENAPKVWQDIQKYDPILPADERFVKAECLTQAQRDAYIKEYEDYISSIINAPRK